MREVKLLPARLHQRIEVRARDRIAPKVPAADGHGPHVHFGQAVVPEDDRSG